MRAELIGGMFIGQSVLDLPPELERITVSIQEGIIAGELLQISIKYGAVSDITIIFKGKSILNGTIDRHVTLAHAVGKYSLRRGAEPPLFGSAMSIVRSRYGIIDVVNRIVYRTGEAIGAEAAVEPSSEVIAVAVVGDDVGAALMARAHMFTESESEALLAAAKEPWQWR